MEGRFLPDWQVDDRVNAFFTTRTGGVSDGPFDSMNLAQHVGDAPASVEQNRSLLPVPSEPCWLEQVHSNRVVNVDTSASRRADAAFTCSRDKVLAVMTADCLPVLLAAGQGDLVGVIHAGWRGLADNVIGHAVSAMDAASLVAWLGPAIGPCHYDVGDDVRERFGDTGFSALEPGKWRMDLYAIAREQLRASGVEQVYGGDDCTYCDEARFYSYRRDGQTGRMAGLIWIEEHS